MERAIGNPPQIPAASTGPDYRSGMNMMFWVRTGVAHVEFEDHEPVQLSAGQGIWIPRQCTRRMHTEAGAVALPLYIAHDDAPIGGADHPLRFEVSPAWHDQLIGHYGQILNGHSPHRYAPAEALATISSSGGHGDSNSALPKPLSAEALTVAWQLLINPADPSTVRQWAAHATCSERTLQRQFLGETGLTFAQWRSRCRIAAAADLLAAGYSVAQTAARVGYADRTSFARAFRKHHGESARELVARSSRPQANGSTARRPPAQLMRSMMAPAPQDLSAEDGLRQAIPTARIPAHTHDFHLLSWLYRGSRETTTERSTYHHGPGDALWIPAGQEHSHAAAPGTISFALAMPTPHALQLSQPLSLHFTSRWNDYLLWQAVSTNSLLKPEPHHHERLLDVFRDQLNQLRTDAVPMPTDPTARAAAHNFLRTVRTTRTDRVPPDVLVAFRRDTGMTFQRWQHVSRMRIARDLLAEGASATSAARQLGYAHLQSFTHAFRSFHGVPPSRYQRPTTGRS